jgi:hypothetical protein
LELERHDGPTHAYIGASPECWALYGQVLAREYEAPAYFAVHGLTVDTYAAQHPGSPGRRQAQSVFVHLIALCLALEHGVEGERAVKLRERVLAAGGREAPWLEPPDRLGEVTVRDVLAASDAGEHGAAVRRWAASVWEAWRPHHERLRSWIEGAL